MSNMKSLSLIVAPTASSLSPKLRRRQNLIERLEEQQQLAKDPNFTISVRRWIKDTEGVKQLIEVQKRIKPWWRKDATGSLYMILKSGLTRLVLDKGMTAIAVGTPDKLEGVIVTLLAAAKAGELDGALEGKLDASKPVMKRS
jgi:hypothetical protein